MKRTYKSGFQKREVNKKKKQEDFQCASSMFTWLKPSSSTSEINDDTTVGKFIETLDYYFYYGL